MHFIHEEVTSYGYTTHHFHFDGCACTVVEPSSPLPGVRWVWKAEFFAAFPKFELEMLHRGYYICYMNVGNTFGCPEAMEHFDRFYELLTTRYKFNAYPILVGLSRGGLYIYNWACRNPEKTGCIYADNPVCDFKSWPGGKGRGPGSPENWWELLKSYRFANEEEALKYPTPIDNAEILVKAGVPIVHAVATEDEVVPVDENTDLMEQKIHACGGKIKVFRHPGAHHPHGLENPAQIADWIEANTRQ